MHQIYIDRGKYNFIYQITIIIYSSLISLCINIILKELSLSESMLINFKNETKEDIDIKIQSENIEKVIKRKLLAFIILSVLLMSFYWYYISCFFSVYENTQIIINKNIFISFGLSMLYPFGLSLIPGIFWILALRAPKKDKNILYKISVYLSMI